MKDPFLRLDRLVNAIDGLPADAVGALCIRGEAGEVVGWIHVRQNKVCWILAKSELPPSDGDRPERDGFEFYLQMAKNRYEALSRDGASQETIPPPVQMCLTSVVPMLNQSLVTEWHGMDVPWEFGSQVSTAQLASAVGRQLIPEPQVRMSEELQARFDLMTWGMALLRVDGLAEPRPVALYGEPPAEATTLLGLSHWATHVMDLARTVDFRADVVVATENHYARVAVRLQGIDAILAGEGRTEGAARVISKSAERRSKKRPGGDG